MEKVFRYEHVVSKIEESIKTLNLKPGDKIASVRTVSRELNVSLNTVFQAYAILEAKGLIYAKPKSGYIINIPAGTIALPSPQKTDILPTNVEVTTIAVAMMKNAKENGIVNFSILAPVNEYLPIAKLNKYVAISLNESRNENYQYPLVDGLPRLLKQIARRTFDWQKSVDQEQLLVTNGCMEAINLCLDVVTKPGDIVAVESPTHHGILQSLEQRGLKALEIGVDPETGLRLNELMEALNKYKIAACIFMPRCQHPTGIAMPESNKIELVKLLGERNIPLIEDDALGELNYIDSNHPAKAYDLYGNVLYCSSFSKTLAPGFRIGWVAAGKYHKELEKLKYGSNISTNGVFQDAIGRYLESGQYEKHLKKMRFGIQAQMLKYVAAISSNFPDGTRLSLPHGGLSVWIQLPVGTDAFTLQKAALKKGIGICPGHIFSTSTVYHNYIRLNFCPLWTTRVERGIKELATLL